MTATVLAGLSVMIMAIANRQNLADVRDPEVKDEEEPVDTTGTN